LNGSKLWDRLIHQPEELSAKLLDMSKVTFNAPNSNRDFSAKVDQLRLWNVEVEVNNMFSVPYLYSFGTKFLDSSVKISASEGLIQLSTDPNNYKAIRVTSLSVFHVKPSTASHYKIVFSSATVTAEESPDAAVFTSIGTIPEDSSPGVVRFMIVTRDEIWVKISLDNAATQISRSKALKISLSAEKDIPRSPTYGLLAASIHVSFDDTADWSRVQSMSLTIEAPKMSQIDVTGSKDRVSVELVETDPDPPARGEQGLGTAATVGIAVGSVVVAVIIGVMIWCGIMSRRMDRVDERDNAPPDP
jgi:hypothetical protein